MLKKDNETIESYPTTGAYTNVNPLTTLSDFTLWQSTCLLSTGPAPKVADLVVTAEPGAVIKWYATETGRTALEGSTPLVTATYYWASQTVNGNESIDRLKVTITVNHCYITIPRTAAIEISANTTTCGGTISNNCDSEVTASSVCLGTSTGSILLATIPPEELQQDRLQAVYTALVMERNIIYGLLQPTVQEQRMEMK